MNFPPRAEPLRPALRRIALGIALSLALLLGLCLAQVPASAFATSARSEIPLHEYVLRFERSYQDVKTLKADFAQSYFAWGRRRVESGTVLLAKGGRMRWQYQQPEPKLFVSTGKQLLLYVPAEKQLTVTPLKGADDVRVPLGVLLSRIDLNKVFSRIEFANQALRADEGDQVLRAIPRARYRGDYSSALIELTAAFDIRRLVVFYPDNSTMQFEFSNFRRNLSVNPSVFDFTPPPGTEVIHQ